MSLSLAVKQGSDPASLSRQDLGFAALLHVLAAVLIMTFGLWYSHSIPEIPTHIEVSLISSAELKKMQRLAQTRSAVKKRKPEAIPTPKKKAKTKPADTFDPFAPLESSSNRTRSTPSSRKNVESDFMDQLSQKEINRYIAMIQSAVQKHWKVPANLSGDIRDPLVEMILNRNGSVQSVRIIESSGNDALDASLIHAIRAAAPFTLPQKQYEAFRTNRIRFHPLR